MMSFTIIVNGSNVFYANTNNTYEYKFIGGGGSVPEGMECMVSSSPVPYSVFPNACNHNFLRVSFPTGFGTGITPILILAQCREARKDE